MTKPKSTTDMVMITKTGVNIVLDASTRSTTDLIMIVNQVGRSGGHITLTSCSPISTTDLLMICRIHPKIITLDFTEK